MMLPAWRARHRPERPRQPHRQQRRAVGLRQTIEMDDGLRQPYQHCSI